MSNKLSFAASRRNNGQVTWGISDFSIMVILFFSIYSFYMSLVFPLSFSSIRLILISLSAAFLSAFFSDGVQPISHFLARWIVARHLTKRIVADDGISTVVGYFELQNSKRDGYIYLVRRFRDGVYKIGKTGDFNRRFSALGSQYGTVFAVALWEVPSCRDAEKIALEMTSQFSITHSRHKELRAMGDEDVRQFAIAFLDYVRSVDIKPRKESWGDDD